MGTDIGIIGEVGSVMAVLQRQVVGGLQTYVLCRKFSIGLILRMDTNGIRTLEMIMDYGILVCGSVLYYKLCDLVNRVKINVY